MQSGATASNNICTVSSTQVNVGVGYTATPAPSTDTYYAEGVWIDAGNPGANHCFGFLLNYIDTSNYYACAICDDATTGPVRVIKVSGGTGSALSSTTQGTVPTSGTDILECKINYEGSSPVITFKNRTTSLEWISVTDSSSPLTETRKAGTYQGATPEDTTNDTNSGLRWDYLKVTEVPASATRRVMVVN
jgi:hypothetical protein